MPRQQLELASGELVAREARSQDDLPDDADGGLRANLVMVGDGFLGGGGGSEGLGLLALLMVDWWQAVSEVGPEAKKFEIKKKTARKGMKRRINEKF